MQKHINVGIIGCGMIAFSKHMPHLYDIDGVNLVAFHNRSKQKALDAQQRFGSADSVVYDDAEALIADKRIDVIHVLTANNTHREYAIKALQAQKHVMVEKPMAKNAKEAHEMLKVAQANNRLLSVAYQNRYRRDVQTLKSLINDGELGEIYMVKAKSIRRRGTPSWGTFTDKVVQGGGPLIDIGSHVLDLSLYLLDFPKISHVDGSTYQKLTHENQINQFGPFDNTNYTVEDSAFAFIKTGERQTITLECSYALNTENEGENILEVYGTKAGALLNNGLHLNYTNHRGYVRETVQVNSIDEGQAEMQGWIEAIRNASQPLVTQEQGYEVSRILEAIYESSTQNRSIVLKD